MENTHNKAIPTEVLGEAQKRISEAAEALAPYLMNLTADQRHSMIKMGDKSLAFVSKAHELAGQNPMLCPPYLDMNAFSIDFTDATQLLLLNNALRQLQQGTDDTSMLAGSEAYQAALMFYRSTKEAAARNVSGAKAVYEELKARFPSTRRRKEVPEESESGAVIN
ncbi:MAG: hypothetical protein LBU91_02720 [Bacteroidales bacterium]|jgi:hypothetical protein|nr:hypothetical protein [Bacteroidales bacterium]